MGLELFDLSHLFGANASSLHETTSTDISVPHLCLGFCVPVAIAIWMKYLKLGISDQVIACCIRTVINLTVLAFVLYPIFSTQNPWVVLGYIVFMLTLGAYETSARPKVQYPGLFKNAWISMTIGVGCVGGIALAVCAAHPFWKAQYAIPLAGMLISNCLNAASLTLDGLLDHVSKERDQVDVLLSFGAQPMEALWPGFVTISTRAMMPTINSMNVMGLVAIPGMMTGQVLGGAPPLNAAKYQMMIMFMILGTIFTVIVLLLCLTAKAIFDENGRLRGDRLSKQNRLKVAQLFQCSCLGKGPPTAGIHEPLLGGNDEASLAPLQLTTATATSAIVSMKFKGLVAGARPITVNLSIGKGERICIMGPSGVGKTTLFKLISDILPTEDTHAQLNGQSVNPQEWRRQVLYMHQGKTPLPGTPRDLVTKISELKINAHRKRADPVALMKKWGLLEVHYDRKWSDLSGGEAQRVMCAIVISTEPACLLLDEATSALDDHSKGLVEDTLQALECPLIFVTHDATQAKRLATQTCQLGEGSDA